MYCFRVVFLLAVCIPGNDGVDSLRFFIIGDMGGIDFEPYSTYVERSTAKEMGKLGSLYAPQFILELGDNFYYKGVTSVDDKRFKLTFESVYTAESLQVPWYVIAGNHDHHGNVSAQILYSGLSKRWKFPNYYYYKEFPFNNGNGVVGLVFIDTILLCGITDDNLSEQPHGPIRKQGADEQWTFIENSLKNSKADYLFVAGHYPVFSVAEHGPTDCLVKQLQPMLDTYQVNGYLCGHEHNLQHLQIQSHSGSSINYFVSGMANFINFSMDHKGSVPPGSLQFHYANILSKGGFLYAEVTASNMTFTFIDASGVQLYSAVVSPRKL